MAVALFMDVHMDFAITSQLRRRQVDVITAQEDGSDQLDDDNVLTGASMLDRVVVTHDIGFKTLAEEWQRQGRPFAGLIFGHNMQVTTGRFVSDLELIAKATDPVDWDSVVVRLPL